MLLKQKFWATVYFSEFLFFENISKTLDAANDAHSPYKIEAGRDFNVKYRLAPNVREPAKNASKFL